MSIDKYDLYGNPGRVLSRKDPNTTCYFWGYNSLYPILKIENADYDGIVRQLGGASIIESISKGNNPSNADFERIESLRKNQVFSNAFITTYKYLPLIGINIIIDPSGKYENYEYDQAGRLKMITDNNSNPVNSYEYKYVNE